MVLENVKEVWTEVRTVFDSINNVAARGYFNHSVLLLQEHSAAVLRLVAQRLEVN